LAFVEQDKLAYKQGYLQAVQDILEVFEEAQ